jgi:hypothetical protein
MKDGIIIAVVVIVFLNLLAGSMVFWQWVGHHIGG